MANLNADLNRINTLRGKIMSDLSSLSGICSRAAREVNSRLHEELLQKKGSTNGLEDFSLLAMIVKKNAMAARNAHMLLKKMRSTEGYSVSEDDVPDETILEEIFDK